MINRRALALLAALPVPAVAQAPAATAGDIRIENPWTRAAGQGGQGAGYMVLRNTGGIADRLLGAHSPIAGRMELHTHLRDGDVMRMRQVSGIEVPPGGSAALQPGGLHLMFIELRRPLEQGSTIPVTLRFERAGEVTVSLAVQAAGARGPGGHHGH